MKKGYLFHIYRNVLKKSAHKKATKLLTVRQVKQNFISRPNDLSFMFYLFIVLAHSFLVSAKKLSLFMTTLVNAFLSNQFMLFTLFLTFSNANNTITLFVYLIYFNFVGCSNSKKKSYRRCVHKIV